jgi:hypothetical protein
MTATQVPASLVILAFLFSCATAFAQDTATAVNADIAAPAFQAGEATEALGISEPTDGGDLLLLGALGGVAYYAYEEVLSIKEEDVATSGANPSNSSPTVNCNNVWTGPSDPQVSVYCQGACSYYNLGPANYSSARSYCNIMKQVSSSALSNCSFCSKSF